LVGLERKICVAVGTSGRKRGGFSELAGKPRWAAAGGFNTRKCRRRREKTTLVVVSCGRNEDGCRRRGGRHPCQPGGMMTFKTRLASLASYEMGTIELNDDLRHYAFS